MHSIQKEIVGVYFYVRHRQMKHKKTNFPAQAAFRRTHRMLKKIKKQLEVGTLLECMLQNNRECLGGSLHQHEKNIDLSSSTELHSDAQHSTRTTCDSVQGSESQSCTMLERASALKHL